MVVTIGFLPFVLLTHSDLILLSLHVAQVHHLYPGYPENKIIANYNVCNHLCLTP